MESKVISFFVSAFSRIISWFDESLCGKLYMRFCAALYRSFQGSLLGRFFRDENKTDGVFKHSLFGKLISLPETFLVFLQRKLSGPISDLIKKSAVVAGVSSWADISIRFYGVVLLVFSFVAFLFGTSGMLQDILLAAAAVLSLVAILINRSISQLFSGSFIWNAVTGLFTTSAHDEKNCIVCSKKSMFAAVIIGVVLSFFYVSLDAKLFVLVVGGLLGAMFLLKYLRLGVFLTVVLAPVLPTMVLVAMSFLCAGIFCIHVISDKDFQFVKNPVNGFVIFFVLALLWGCINSFAVIHSVKQVAVHLSFILFYFVVINTIRTKEQWLSMVKLFLCVAFLVGAYGVFQNFAGVNSTESWVDETMFEDIKVRVYSFFDNPNVLGEFLVLTIPMVIAVLWNKNKSEHKVVFGVFFLCMAACMIFTWSRGAWLGLVLACAILLLSMDKRWVFFGVLAICVLPALLVATGNTAILQRLFSIGNTADTSTAYRVSIWSASLDIIRDFWVSGIGIGSEAFKNVYPMYAKSGADFALHAHNLYLQIWVECGILGFASLLATLIRFIKQTFSFSVMAVKKDNDIAKFLIAIGAGLIGFLFQGLTDYVWYNYKILMLFWIILAFGVSGANLVPRKTVPAEEGSVSAE